MGLTKIARTFLSFRGYATDRAVNPATLDAFFQRFRENFVSVDLIRMGGTADGGYLMPDLAGQLTYCFSPGVSDSADFEEAITQRYGLDCFLADASVEAPPIANDKFSFIPKFIGSRTEGEFVTLSDWINQAVGPETGDMLLQMDIEGYEYDVLINESSETLSRFSCLIIEFHFIERLVQKGFFQLFNAVMEKLSKDFVICHAHPNNVAKLRDCCGVSLPSLVEITFLRRDLAETLVTDAPISLPHPLDRANVPGRPDIELPPEWWRS